MRKGQDSRPQKTARPYYSILGINILVLLGPLLYYQHALYLVTPDIQHIKGKILRILTGQLYADPVSGFPTFHPPLYHLILAPFKAIGLSFDLIFFGVTAFYIILGVYFLYKLIGYLWGNYVSLWVCLMLPFIAYFMGYGQLYLESSFYFSVPFFLAGLWLYLRSQKRGYFAFGYGVLWGLSFMLSPGYLFPIGLLFIYRLIIWRDFRQSLQGVAAFAVTLIPFYVQAYVIFSQKMYGTQAFALWRGFPGLDFVVSILNNLFLTPPNTFLTPWTWIAFALASIGIVGLFKEKGQRVYAAIFFAAFILTLYHFMPQYAIRVKFFFSIFLVATAIRFMLNLRIKNTVRLSILSFFVICGLFYHYKTLIESYTIQSVDLVNYNKMLDAGLIASLNTSTMPNQFVIATADTYRHYVMPVVPVHGLAAWRTGEYYQVPTAKAVELNQDYDSLLQCRDTSCLNAFCRKYNMITAVVQGPQELALPVFQVINHEWILTYKTPYFLVFKRSW
jgi:hypothetical protein